MTANQVTANQVVAYNLKRAREELGLTQELAAQRLEWYLGKRWSKASFSVAERSAEDRRVREFDANALLAFSRAFEKPVGWFFTPPENVKCIYAGTSGPRRAIGRDELLDATAPIPLGDDHVANLRRIADALERRELGRRM